MDGVPVYLASMSRYDPSIGQVRLYPYWPLPWRKDGETLLRRAIGPLGDPGRERLFRMNLTLCLHRALREDEIARLPSSFFDGEPEGIAGAPVEVLKETVPGSLSTKPCANPVRSPLPGLDADPHGWIPQDCGECETCHARAAA